MFGGDDHGTQLVEHVVVREAGVAVVERLEAVQEPELVERGQPVLSGVHVGEVHLGQPVGGEDPVTVEHGQDGAVPFGEPVRHGHHQPVADLRSKRRIHAHHPKESGFATGRWEAPHAGTSVATGCSVQAWRRSGGGDGDRGGDPVEPPHAEYPARRSFVFVCSAARPIAGPSTNGSRFAFWEAGGATPAASVFVASDLPRREL